MLSYLTVFFNNIFNIHNKNYIASTQKVLQHLQYSPSMVIMHIKIILINDSQNGRARRMWRIPRGYSFCLLLFIFFFFFPTSHDLSTPCLLLLSKILWERTKFFCKLNRQIPCFWFNVQNGSSLGIPFGNACVMLSFMKYLSMTGNFESAITQIVNNNNKIWAMDTEGDIVS